MQNVYVKPRVDPPGAAVIIPDPAAGGRALTAEGDWKPLDQFWTRRLRDNDVEVATPPAIAAPASAAQVNGTAQAAPTAPAPAAAPAPVAPELTATAS